MQVEALLNKAILETADHAGRAMLLLDDFRHSSDPQMLEAYRLVHDLMADLGAIRMCAHLVIAEAARP